MSTEDRRLVLPVHTFAGTRPVLLIHGFTRSAELDWIETGWPEALAAAGRGAIAVDLPGHGTGPTVARGAMSVDAIIAAADEFDPIVNPPQLPTLFVAGDEDSQLDHIAETLPFATYVVVPGDHYRALISAEFRTAAIDFVTTP